MKIVENIEPTLFREYDLRGIYGSDITSDVAYTIGKSFGTYITSMNEQTTIVGHDNRESGVELNDSLIAGIISTGVDVIRLGLVTTPMYYYAKKVKNFKTGIMITASHNPREYNGFKISFDTIGNAYGEAITAFRKFTHACQFIDGNGTVTDYDIRPQYKELITSSITMGNKKVKVVADCGNGTGSIIIKELMDLFDIEFVPLYCDSDPTFPNHHPDPAVAKNMVDLGKKVVELGYDLGIGIDGDADRVGIVNEKGQIIPIDMFMLIIYRSIRSNMKALKALFDVKCGRTLMDGLDKLELEKVMYRTGASYTNMMVNSGNFDFGGEFSGHLFFRDKFPGFDDGIYAGLRMIEILSHSEAPMSDYTKDMDHYESTEELKVQTTEDKKFELVALVKEYCINHGYQINDIDGVRVEWSDAWALVRASNTGPNITVRFEAKDKVRLEEITLEFMGLLNELQ